MNKLSKLLVAISATIAMFVPAAPAFAVDIPVNTVAPVIVGNMSYARTITATPGTWTATGSITYTYNWYLCTAAIPAATATVPAGCTALVTTSGNTNVGGSTVYLLYGANRANLTLLTNPVPASMTGKFLTFQEVAATATDSASMVAANSEPLVAVGSRPSVTTLAATAIGTTGVTLNATVTANNTQSQVRFLTSISPTMATGVPASNGYWGDFLNQSGSFTITSGPTHAWGASPSNFSLTLLVGFNPGTVYYFQAYTDSYSDIATTAGRYTTAQVLSFTTKNIVTYSTAGSNSGAAPTDSSSYVVGTDLITFKDQGSLVKTNSSFVGWSYGGTTYREGDTLLTPLGGITFNPVWVSGLAVSYFANGGTGAVPVESASPFSSASSAVAKTAGSLVRTGYDFTGWNTKADGTGTTYAAGATVPVTAPVKLYAQWAPVASVSSSSTPAPVVVAPQVTGFSARKFSTGSAGNVILSGNNFANVSSVKVISSTGVVTSLTKTLNANGQLVLNVPTANADEYSLVIQNADGITTFSNAFVVETQTTASSTDSDVIFRLVVGNFAAGSSRLSASQLKSVNSTKTLKGVKSITCVGYTEGPTILSTDGALAKARASAACTALKKIFGTQVTYQMSGATTVRKGAAVRRVEIVFSK